MHAKLNIYTIEHWEQVKGKINTKHRGKQRTLVQRLKKGNVT